VSTRSTRLNFLVIVCDTLRRDHLGFYGNRTVRTPNLDRLAEQSVVFDRAYCCSFPTLPCRAELFTGRFVFPHLNWGPLPPNEVVLADVLAEAGYTCTMVTDNFPMCRSGYGYDRGFHSRIRIRGQWYDNFQPKETPFSWPCSPEKLRGDTAARLEQYLRNTSSRRGEEDCFAPQVVGEAARWLEANHDRAPFLLYVDMFDPHEPWDPPGEYVKPYDAGEGAEDVIYPAFPSASAYRPEDLRRMRALYAGEITLVDRWLGLLLETLDSLGRTEDTVVVFLSDHGILLGERGLVGKMGRKKDGPLGWPTYAELARIPLVFRVPGLPAGRREGFAHPGDVAPTLLDLAGVPVPSAMRAASLLPVLRGEKPAVRDVAVSSWSLRGWSAHRPSVTRTDEWALVTWRSGIEPELYCLPVDPGETRNIYPENRAAAREVHARYLAFLREHEAPARHALPRRWLGRWPGRGSSRPLTAPPAAAGAVREAQ
jgi:arylsulfatase A-like enzyme